jgi:DNA-directed RNA polymerase subunit M/transcription elongation factor TFIIS
MPIAKSTKEVKEVKEVEPIDPIVESIITLIDTVASKATPLSDEFYRSPYNAIRRAKLMLFSSCYASYEKYNKMPLTEKMAFIKKLERSCLNTTVSKANEANIRAVWDCELFVELYHSICYKISANIDKDNSVKNPKLGDEILDNKVQLSILPKMSSQELYPEKYRTIINKIELSKNVVQTVKTSVMYRCRRCGQNKCTIINKIIRSLDEGVNLEITCQVCFLKWTG